MDEMNTSQLTYEAVLRLENKVDGLSDRVTKLEVKLENIASKTVKFETQVEMQLDRIDEELKDLQTWKWKTVGFLAAASAIFAAILKFVAPLIGLGP